jgi:hypothetical protein
MSNPRMKVWREKKKRKKVWSPHCFLLIENKNIHLLLFWVCNKICHNCSSLGIGKIRT